MKGVQCYELFGGIALKIHTFSFHFSFLAVNRGRLVGGTEMASPCICSPQSLQSQLGFPGTHHMDLPACYTDEWTSNLS